MTLLIFYLVLALGISFLCSVMEAVILSVTPSFIQSQMERQKKWARSLFYYKSDIDRPLAAILSLNTIAHTVGAAGVGAQAGLVFQDLSTGIVSGVLTLLILILSEIIPKTLGATYWKALAPAVTFLLRWLQILMYPLILMSQGITRLLRQDKEPSVERNEIIALADIGKQEGTLSEEEAAVLKNTINLRHLAVRDVMTPRTVMMAAHQDMTLNDFLQSDQFQRFSRIPVYNDGKDDIQGFVHKHDLLAPLNKRESNATLKDFMRDIPVVPETQSLYSLYDFLTRDNQHIALVVEEFGGTAGLVTMEDLLETLLGLEIVDEYDDTADLRKYARQRWESRARRLGIPLENSQDDALSGSEN